MIKERKFGRTESRIPENTGGFHDAINNVAYVARGCQLLQHDLQTNITKPLQLKPFKEEVGRSLPDIPRFVSNPDTVKNGTGAYVSPSGLCIVNADQSEDVLITNLGYSKGVHFWQFYCPVSLYGMSMGVARKEGLTYKYEMFEFTSSTSRTVSFRLDLNVKKISAWVNKTIPVRLHSIALTEGTWYPCIKLKGKGNPLIFNPFCTDPENIISPYNPFNTNVLNVNYPAIKQTSAKPVSPKHDERLKLIALNDNQLCIYDSNGLAKVFTRNKRTHRFDFDSFESPTDANSLIELSFDINDINSVNIYLTKSGLRPLQSQRIINVDIYIEATLQQWFEFFRYIMTHLQNNKGPLIVIQILLEKLESIRPYLYLLHEHIQPGLYSSYNRLAEWRKSKDHSYFDVFDYEFVTALSDVTNFLPPTRLFDKETINPVVGFGNKYITVATAGKISLFNTDVALHKVAEFDTRREFNKGRQLRNMDELAVNNLNDDREGPRIFKILANCMTSNKHEHLKKQPKKTVPNVKFVKILIEDFKFSQEDANEALIHTNNDSIDEAVAYITVKYAKNQPAKLNWLCDTCTLMNSSFIDTCEACGNERTEQCEVVQEQHQQQIQQSHPICHDVEMLSLVHTGNTLAPVLICFRQDGRVHLWLVGPHPEHLNKFLFKEDYGFVSFTSFEYCEKANDLEIESVEYMDYFFGVLPDNKWILLDQTVSDLAATDIAIACIGAEIQLCSIQKQGFITKQPLKINFASLYTDTPNIEIGDVSEESYSRKAILVTNETIITEELATVDDASVIMGEKLITNKKKKANKHTKIAFDLEYLGVESNDVISAEVIINKSEVEVGSQGQSVSEVQSLTLLESKEKEAHEQFIPLVVQQGPPGCNMSYPICSILYPAAKSFLANYPYQVIFKHLHGKKLQINSVMIERIGKNHNVKEVMEGLIWLSDHLNVAPSVRFKFKFAADSKRVVVKIPLSHPKKYLFILPMFENGTDPNLPFEIGFVGATFRKELASTSADNMQHFLGKHKIDTIISISQEGRAAQIEKEKIQIMGPNTVKVLVELPNDTPYRLEIKRPFRLIESSVIQQQPVAVAQDSSSNIIQKLSVPGNDYRQLTHKLASQDLSQLDEESILELLNKLILHANKQGSQSKNEFIDRIVKQLLHGSHGKYVQQLLLSYLTNASFKAIPNVNSLDLLLSLNLLSGADIQKLLGETLVQIKKERSPRYAQLRKHSRWAHLMLESECYSSYYYSQVQSTVVEHSEPIYNFPRLPLNFVIVKEKYIRTIMVDLDRQVDVKYLLLCFEKSDLRTKMRIKVFRQDKELIYSTFYQDHCWLQLARNSYSKQMKKLFKDPLKSGLNCLGIELNTNARYLTIEISHTILPIIGEQSEIDNLPFIEIIPEIFGNYLQQESPDIPRIAKYFLAPKETTHHISKVNINNLGCYQKHAVHHHNREYHLYQGLNSKSEDGEVPSDRQTANKIITKRLDDEDWDSLLKTHKTVAKKPTGHIGLDYHYTLIMKLLEKHPSALPESLAEELYKTLVVDEIGPVSVASLRAVLKYPRLFTKALPYLNDELYSIFTEAKFPEKQIRQYIKTLVSTKQANQDKKATYLLMKLLQSQPNAQEWLEQITLLGQESGHDEEFGKILATSNWRERDFIKKYLINLSKSNPELFTKLVGNLNSESLARHLVDTLKIHTPQSGEYQNLLIPVVLKKLHEVKQSEVFESLAKQVSANLKKSDHHDNANEQFWSILLACSKSELSEKTQLQVLELLLHQSDQIKLEFIEIAESTLKKHPNVTPNVIVGMILQHSLHFSLSSDAYMQLLLKEKIVLETGMLNTLTQVGGQYLMKHCCIGGTEGTKCATQNQLAVLNWMSKVLELIIIGSKDNLFQVLKDFDVLDNIIRWYMLNNTEQLNPINPAYRTPSYELIARIESKIMTILKGAGKHTAKLLKKIFQNFTKLNEQVKKAVRILESTRHILAYRLHSGTNTLIKRLMEGHPELLASFVCESHFFDSLVKTLKDEKPLSSETINLGSEQELAAKFTIDPNGDIKSEVKDWTINKGGNSKNGLLNVKVNSPKLTLTSQQSVSVSSIIVGFLATDTVQKNNIYPSTVSCWVGDSADSLILLGNLEAIDDQNFSCSLTRVFGLNLNRIKSSDKNHILNTLFNKGFKFMEFRMKRPQLASLSDIFEGFQKSSDNGYYTVSFVSVNGYSEPTSPPSFVQIHLKLLSLLSQPIFKSTLDSLIQKDFFKKHFPETVSTIAKWISVPQYTKLISDLFTAISENSKELGNQIIDSFFRQSKRDAMTAVLIGDLISKNTRLAAQRLTKFYQYLLESLRMITAANSHEYAHYFDVFIQSLEVSALNIHRFSLPDIELKLIHDDAENIFNLYIGLPAIRSHLIGFFTAIVIERLGVKTEKDILQKLVRYIWQKPNKSDYYPLFAPAIPTSPEVISWFVDGRYLQQLIKEVIEDLNRNIQVINSISLLDSLSASPIITEEINKSTSQLLIFKALSDTKTDKTLLKPVSRQAIAHFVSLFQRTCIDTPAEIQFSFMLKEILTDLPTKYSTEFIYQFLIPLVNSYKSVSVVLLPVDRSTNMYIDRPNRVITKCPIKANSERLDVQSKFPTSQVQKVSNGVWRKISKQQAISNSFLGKSKVMYAEDASGSKRLLLKVAGDGQISTFINDKHEQYTMLEGLSSLKVGDYQIKGTETDLTISGLESPKVEFYAVDEQPELSLLTNQLLLNMERPQVLDSTFVRKESFKNYLTHQSVYEVPAQLTVSDLIKQINLAGLTLNKLALERFSLRLKGNGAADANSTLSDLSKSSSSGGILYLQYDAEGLFEYSSISSILKQDKDAKSDIVPTIGLFRSFEKQGGVEKIIEVVIESVSIWKNKEIAKKWLQYVQELKSFSSFPHFFSLYMKNKQNVELLFNLLAALPDKEQQQKWEPKEKQSVKELYRIVSEVFVVDNSSKIREFAMGNNFFEMMLQRLHLISKEAKRVLNVEEQPTEELPSLPIMAKQTSEQDTKKRKTTKKKGVGYGNDSSSNQKWDVAETELTKKQMNEQILNIIGILDKFLDFQNWSPPKRLLESIYSSALLPIIEAALRGGSLLEIGKDSEVFKAYLHLIKTIAKHESLIPCLLNIPQTYTPRQTESVVDLLKQLEGTSKIFLSCLTVDTNEQNKASEEIAKEIVSTATIVDEAVQGYNINKGEDNAEIQRILELPLQQKYKHFMKDLRFDYISMKDNTGKFKHHYASSYSATYTPPVAKTIRLAQELADISTALPVEHTNAIYVRCDKERVDFMQALIMGSNGTPYGHGAYLFDIHFEDTYPSVSPKVNLTTTGHGKVRFNPNLYACGKVCLSLLGTWRGNATENWDPKVSTLLQVLVSIQSIIMAEEVYFNEPGFEHEQGTDEGDRKNEAYSNIVRYCNIKYAMIDNIRNPPKGFETVIRRHFYLKKDEILQECKKWVKYASKREASYTGLINDHNNNWCTEFKKSKTKYKEMLEEAIRELEQQLNKLPAPSPKDLIKVEKSPSKKKQIAGKTGDLDTANQLNLEQVDVTYGTDPQKSLELDINDDKVKDRWSRYIGAMGIDAVNRQAKANVAVFGLGPFAIEVVKNIVLSGCRRITLIDDSPVTWSDLSGQFFLTEADIFKNRVESCLYKIQELNLYVKVDRMSLDLTDLSKLKEYTVIFVTELPYTDQIKLNNFCRENNIKFISADCNGPYARLFNDFGSEFEVLDKNGEDPTEVMIESITNAERGVVTLLKGSKHPYQDGDVVTIIKVDGMNSLKEDATQLSINGTIHKIKVISSRSFEIGDTREYSQYIKNGLAKNLKIPVKLNFPSFESAVLSKQNIPLDQNLAIADFTRLSHNNLLHFCFITLDKFRDSKKALPSQWSSLDADTFIDLYKTVDVGEFTHEKQKFIRLFSFTCEGSFPPLCAFFGGYASQEIVKAITSKYMPTNSMYYCDFDSVLPNMPQDLKDWQPVVDALQAQPKDNRNGGLRTVIGESLMKEIEKCRLFMIGSGAIGCELLKNYAMLNLGTAKVDTVTNTKQGMIILTDPDHIEVSNLNRQFLFREKHIRKPKSSTAAASVIQMNPNLKGHISARLDKISQATKDIFSDEFFRDLTIVTNALDNVAARRYVDLRCIQNKIPLLESGTLGPKGHVQVIIPYKTETYGSKEDPAEDGEIPHCTLKMFPEETLHCVEWARDKFGSKFSLKPKALIKILQTKESDKPESTDIKVLRASYKLLKNHPINFDGCIAYAIKKFYKYFRNDIKQLLYTYPLEAKTKDGQMFWRLPKRPPHPIEEFDPKNLLHCSFVSSLAVMVAKVYNISFPTNFRTEQGKHQIGELAAKIPIEPFVPSDQKAKLIAQQLNKEKEKKLEVEEEDQASPQPQEQTEEELMNKIIALRQETEPKISAEEFEKDCDENGHIDLIYAMSNLRAINYALDPMDWITTKLKAGRIVPALSTTTTAIAGLQTYQLVKYLKKVKVGDMRNAFINLAVPILQLSEPGEVEKIKLTEETIVTVWDRWDIPCIKNITVEQLFKTLEDKFKLKPRDLIYGSMPIYMAATMDLESKKAEKDALVTKPLKDLLGLDEGAQSVDITVTFSKLEGGELLKATPPVRLVFEHEKEQNLPVIEQSLQALPASASAAPNNNNGSAYNSDEQDSISNGSIE